MSTAGSPEKPDPNKEPPSRGGALKFLRNVARFALAVLIVQIVYGKSPLQAPDPQKTAKSAAAKAAPAPGRIWGSKTTGKEYRVWTEDQKFHAEWTNVPPEFAAKGAYIRTVCQRRGQKWVGESQEYLPCSVGTGKQEHIANFCRLTTGFELDSMTATRITGRTEALKQFDCAKCKVLEKEWKSFVWVPKK